MHECVLHNRNPPYLHKVLMGEYGDAKSPSLVWGLKKEKCAWNLYRRVAGKKTLLHDYRKLWITYLSRQTLFRL